MRGVRAGLGGLVLAAGLTATFALSAGASPSDGAQAQARNAAVADDLPNAAEEKRRELREVAIKKVIAGDAKVRQRGASKVVKVGRTTAAKNAPAEDQYVELAREKTDKIFVVLAEFGNDRHPSYPDRDTDPNTPGPSRFDGPLHNQIPAPDRTKDNKTIWEANYNRAHFQKLYFGTGANDNSVKKYYERQSSGRYSVDGQVTEWVKVPFNEARYGRSNGFPCAGAICANSYELIRDALAAWVAGQKSAGKTDAQIAAGLKSFDQWDRNDYDNDGNFNEADGYIDHFQIVHAGGDQADGDPYQGEDAIWSHRSKAFADRAGLDGPDFNKDGGLQIGTTGLWVADYTMQPENGGVSVFAHEYAHDLGLPDEYDTAAATGTQENAVNWWSIMAQSRQTGPGDVGLGTRASDFGAWDKLQLGWLDYEVVPAGQTRALDLGPSEYNSAKAQGVVVPLPKKTIVTQLGAPHGGTKQWWSGQGDEYESTLTRQATLPAGTASLSFWARWNIEDCGPDACDYAYVEVDDGTGFKPIPGSIANAAEGNGIDGYHPDWTQATFDLSAYAGKTIGLRLRYATDPAQQGQDVTKPAGIFADDFTLTAGGGTVFTDGAESGTGGWTADGFQVVGASKSVNYDNYYVMSNREYVSYDQYLKTGPYNAADPTRGPNWFEHFAYQNGLIVSYWDTSYTDNNESVHPGAGEILAIDANPRPIYRLDGLPWRGRIQTYDAPFSLETSDSMTLHMPNGQPSYIRGQPAVPVFDDSRSYWDATMPNVGVKVPNAGVRVAVQKQDGTAMRIRISSTKPGV